MIEIMYIGDTIIIAQSTTHGFIYYLEKDIVRDWSLEWNELLGCYASAISNDSNGKFYDDVFKEIVQKEIEESS